MIGSVIGTLTPDMDQATNRLWDLLPAGDFVGDLFRNIMLRHRTISHSILGSYVYYRLITFIIPKILNPNYINIPLVVASVMIGFFSHILADMLTKEGVPLLFPLTVKVGIPPFESLRITTGKLFEKFVIFPGVLAYIAWLVVNQREVFVHLVKLIQN